MRDAKIAIAKSAISALSVEMASPGPKRSKVWRLGVAGTTNCSTAELAKWQRAAPAFFGDNLVVVSTEDDSASQPKFAATFLSDACLPTTQGFSFATALSEPAVVTVNSGGNSLRLVTTQRDDVAKTLRWQVTILSSNGTPQAQSAAIEREYESSGWATNFLPCTAEVGPTEWLLAGSDIVGGRRKLVRRFLRPDGIQSSKPDIDLGEPLGPNASEDWCFADQFGRVCANTNNGFGTPQASWGSPKSTYICFDAAGMQLGTVAQLKQPNTFVAGVATHVGNWVWWLMPNWPAKLPGYLLFGPSTGGPGADALVDLK